MSQENQQLSDSFSGNEGSAVFSGSPTTLPQNKGPRSDSPVFGGVGAPSQQVRRAQNPENLNVADPKEKLRTLTQALNDQQDEYKDQLVRIETINMMTKYQLVFIKMESALVKLASIIKKRDSMNSSTAFSKIYQQSTSEDAKKKLKAQIIYYKLKSKLEKLTHGLSVCSKIPLASGFRQIWLHSKITEAEKGYKDEREVYIKQYNEKLSSKDQEIQQSKKKIDELNTVLTAAKTKEGDLINKLKGREKQLQALESERVEALKNRKGQSVEQNQNMRLLEEQIRELQLENDELREKLSSAENNVGSFIKEMSDLLDTHEISTNIGSENNSFQNHEFDEDFDLANKIKDKTNSMHMAKNTNKTSYAQKKVIQPKKY